MPPENFDRVMGFHTRKYTNADHSHILREKRVEKFKSRKKHKTYGKMK